METLRKVGSELHRKYLRGVVLLLLAPASLVFARKLPPPTRVWSVGPLTKANIVMGISFGARGATITGPHVDSQTGSSFTATRSVAFAGDRIVLASKVGERSVEGAHVPEDIYELLSLDAKTGEVKETRQVTAFASLQVFATDDAHVIVSGRSLLRLTPDLEDSGTFDYGVAGHKSGIVKDISSDGSTLGDETVPGFELISARTLKATLLTPDFADATSISSKGFVTDNVLWLREYPKDRGFVTYVDATGKHLLYHGKCGGSPQFLTNDLVLEHGCKSALVIDIQGNVVRTLSTKGWFSFAGVSQNGKRFALQTKHPPEKERFVIYSTDTWAPITEVMPKERAEDQSWTAFSPDGSLFVVGSPLKLTLYRLP